MDKFEYNIKVEKMKKLMESRDYETAAQVADTIDWKRTKNIRMLSVVSMIYERTHRYSDAKNILMLCYERGPGGRRLIYKLTELSVKEHNFEDAEMFYQEYLEMAPDDLGVYTLKYGILAEQGAPIEQQIAVLEAYKAQEFDERWGYELAKLYHKAGRTEECVRLCDEIILWFSVGPYVERAAKLKSVYEPLTPDQEAKVKNQEEYAEQIRQVAEECESQLEKKIEEAAALKQREIMEAAQEVQNEQAGEPPAGVQSPEEPLAETESAGEEYITSESGQDGNPYQEAQAREMEAMLAEEEHIQEQTPEETETAFGADSQYTQTMDTEDYMGLEWESEVEKVISAFNKELDVEEKEELPKEESMVVPGLLYVSAPRAEEGMEYATEAIKELHKVKGEEAKKVARITGSKLNVLGLSNSLKKLNGADLVIVEAASLSTVTLAEILRATQKKTMQTIIVFVDTPDAIESLDVRAKNVMVDVLYQLEQEERARKEAHKIQLKPVMMPEKSLIEAKFAMADQLAATKEEEPDLLDLDMQIPDPVVHPVQQPSYVPPVQPAPVQQPKADWDTQKPAGAYTGIDAEKLKQNLVSVAESMVYQEEDTVKAEPAKPAKPAKNKELSAPDFVAKIKEYAEDLDCVIEDIAGLAIYALADQYSEEGMALTDELAKEVTEAAVIRADKRGIGRLFSSKYDKEGRLILKEAHFKI